MLMRQEAPDPQPLYDLVAKLRYRSGWRFYVTDMDRGQGSKGLTLDIITLTADSYHQHSCNTCLSVVTDYRVHHYFIVPAAAYDERSWRRWLLDRVLDVESHEACEFFQIGDERPYAPSHGPGNDPYLIREIGTELDQRTRFTGEVNA